MKRIAMFVTALAIWLLLTWSLAEQNVIVGVIVCVFVTLVFGSLFPGQTVQMLNPRRYLWFLYYLPVFLWHVFKANLDVAYRVLHPDVPIRPGIVKVKTSLKTEIAQTFLANSITLTPGTLTVDIVDGLMYIHWIYVRSDDPEVQTQMIVSRFERILKGVFE